MPYYAERGKDEQTQSVKVAGSCLEWPRRCHCLRETRRVCRIEDGVWHVYEESQYGMFVWLESLAKVFYSKIIIPLST